MFYLKCKDILQLMIEASGEEGDSDEEKETSEPPTECPAHKKVAVNGIMMDKEVVENSFLFLFAGNETTSTSLSFAAYFLAVNPDIQEKLQSEIDAYFEDKPVSCHPIPNPL
jgi:cytochrome P450 family 3 subfamily A